MNDKIQIIFGLLGGMAVFIYGMNMMSECLQKAAGEKMRGILSLLTRNPVLGVLAGALTTAVLQSSSATTVMAIGFVSAGLMTLPQAISIIFGANIGTTITAQIIAFKITDYIYVFIFMGFFISFIAKPQKIKNIGQTIFAFGLLFLGIETMGSVVKPLASSPFFTDMIGRVAGVPVLGVLVGTAMTFVVQSSSATIAVLQNFAAQTGPDGVSSLIGLTGAIPILLGDNVGTTVTTLIAGIGQSRDAKRTALAHCIFNISGCLLFVCLVKPYATIIRWLSPPGAEVEVISRQIANAHTGFNLVMTLIWIPLIGIMVQLVMKIIPDGDAGIRQEASESVFWDSKLVGQPAASLQIVEKEVARCSELVEQLIADVREFSGRKKETGITLESIVKKADMEHNLSNSISEYLTAMFSGGVMAEEQAARGTHMMYVLYDIDRIAALCNEFAGSVAEQNDKKRRYSKEARKDLRRSLSMILDMYVTAMQAILHGDGLDMQQVREKDGIDMQQIREKKAQLTELGENMKRAHMERVRKKKCSAKLTVGFNNVLQDIDRMGSSCINLADTAVAIGLREL